jgi:hypothetical protein
MSVLLRISSLDWNDFSDKLILAIVMILIRLLDKRHMKCIQCFGNFVTDMGLYTIELDGQG